MNGNLKYIRRTQYTIEVQWNLNKSLQKAFSIDQQAAKHSRGKRIWPHSAPVHLRLSIWAATGILKIADIPWRTKQD